MTDVPGLVKAIAEYGVLIVIAGIFLFAAVRFINLFFEWLRARTNKSTIIKQDQEGLQIRNEINKDVYEHISEYLIEHDAIRVQVIEFSNTVMNIAHLPFKYMSCTYEVVDMPDRKEFGHHIDKLPTSLYTPFFTALHNQSPVQFDITDPECPMGGVMREFMQGTEETYALCAIVVSHDKAIGYVQATKEIPFDDDDVTEMASLADKIAGAIGKLNK